MTLRPAWIAVLLTVVSASPGIGQSAEAAGERVAPIPPWLSRWRPLESIGDLPRTVSVVEHRFPDLLMRPDPRVGQLWTVGNPAGLALEATDTRVDFSLGYADDSGDYRRPLEPGSRSGARFEGTGWRPLGERGGVIGRVGVERNTLDDGNVSNVLVPYAGSPFAVLDTIGDAQNRTLTRIEGAGGWRLGTVAVGVGLGYESQDTRTRTTNVPRTNRTATPGATAGVVWQPGRGHFTVGVHGRWQQTVENMSALAIGAASRFYALDGYTEPVAFDLNAANFQRRFERTAWAAGVSTGGRLSANGRWIAYGQHETRSEDRFSPRTNDPLTDTWEADGWTFGAATRFDFGALEAVIDARFTNLDGEGRRGDIELLSFTSSETRFTTDAEVRWRWSDRWRLAGRFGLLYEDRLREDLIESTYTDISAWSPSVAVEVARWLNRRVAVSIGGSAIHHGPTSRIPDAQAIGPAYAKWIAPDAGLLALRATGWAGHGTISVSASDATSVWLRGRYRSATPEASGLGPLNSPEGRRNGWLIMLGASFGPDSRF